jgi:hypothetical protein
MRIDKPRRDQAIAAIDAALGHDRPGITPVPHLSDAIAANENVALLDDHIIRIERQDHCVVQQRAHL